MLYTDATIIVTFPESARRFSGKCTTGAGLKLLRQELKRGATIENTCIKAEINPIVLPTYYFLGSDFVSLLQSVVHISTYTYDINPLHNQERLVARRYLAPVFGSGALFLGGLPGFFLAGDGGFMFLVFPMGFFGLCPFGGVGYGLGVLHFGSPGRWLAR